MKKLDQMVDKIFSYQPLKPLKIEWLTTSPNPRVISHTNDAGQRGWKTHAVNMGEKTNLSEVKYRTALCGIIPRHGWGMDLFIEDKCTRCIKALAKLSVESCI